MPSPRFASMRYLFLMHIGANCSHEFTLPHSQTSNQSDYHRQHYIILTVSFIFIVMYWLFLSVLAPILDAIIKADVIRTVPLPLYSSSLSSSASSSSSSNPAYVAGNDGIHSIKHGPPSPTSSPLVLAGPAPSSVAVPLVEKSNLPNDFYIGPYLDGNEMTNITVQKGTTAYLPCKVFIYVYNIQFEFFFLVWRIMCVCACVCIWVMCRSAWRANAQWALLIPIGLSILFHSHFCLLILLRTFFGECPTAWPILIAFATAGRRNFCVTVTVYHLLAAEASKLRTLQEATTSVSCVFVQFLTFAAVRLGAKMIEFKLHTCSFRRPQYALCTAERACKMSLILIRVVNWFEVARGLLSLFSTRVSVDR